MTCGYVADDRTTTDYPANGGRSHERVRWPALRRPRDCLIARALFDGVASP